MSFLIVLKRTFPELITNSMDVNCEYRFYDCLNFIIENSKHLPQSMRMKKMGKKLASEKKKIKQQKIEVFSVDMHSAKKL